MVLMTCAIREPRCAASQSNRAFPHVYAFGPAVHRLVAEATPIANACDNALRESREALHDQPECSSIAKATEEDTKIFRPKRTGLEQSFELDQCCVVIGMSDAPRLQAASNGQTVR